MWRLAVLPAAARLRRRAEFTAAVRGGRRSSRGVLVVHLHTVPPTQGPPRAARVGFVVPRTVGGAVERNKVRRRLRQLVRERLDRLPPGSWLVVRALPGAATRPYPNLAVDLDAALAAAARRRS